MKHPQSVLGPPPGLGGPGLLPSPMGAHPMMNQQHANNGPRFSGMPGGGFNQMPPMMPPHQHQQQQRPGAQMRNMPGPGMIPPHLVKNMQNFPPLGAQGPPPPPFGMRGPPPHGHPMMPPGHMPQGGGPRPMSATPHFPQNVQNLQNSVSQFNQRLVEEIQQNHPMLSFNRMSQQHMYHQQQQQQHGHHHNANLQLQQQQGNYNNNGRFHTKQNLANGNLVSSSAAFILAPPN